MTKHSYLILASLAVIGFVTYRSIPAPQTKASNVQSDYEYFYTNNLNEEEEDMSDKPTLVYNPDSDGVNDSVYLSGTAGDEVGGSLGDIASVAGGEYEDDYPSGINTSPSSTTVLVTKELGLPATYEPSNLIIPAITFASGSTGEKRYMQEEAALAFEKLYEQAKSEGYIINGVSGYRSYQRQSDVYNRSVTTNGAEHASLYSAKAGYSEHQTGLAIDVSCDSIDNQLTEAFGSTKEGQWLEAHCAEYGFIIRYPKDKSDITGYSYEPWHIRYVGETLAKELTSNHMCLEEYYGYSPSSALTTTSDYGTSIDIDEQ